MKEQLVACLRLMRADRPVGTVLLACPVLWAIWIASAGAPEAATVLIFLCGAFVMRSAGCVINDYADRDIDNKVKRTRDRPLTSGKITVRSAWVLFGVLLLFALILLSLLPLRALLPAMLSLFLACLYPFAKRFFRIPQLVLGMAYASSILMVFMTIVGHISIVGWLLFVAVSVWTVAYDTFYAMVDRDDDVVLGVQSSALLFGERDVHINALLMVVFILLMALVGWMEQMNAYYYLGLLCAIGCFVYQLTITKRKGREECFMAFLNNQWVGVCVFLGVLLNYL